MLSQKQFADATNHLKAYGDALKCVEQIAERRMALNHYRQTTFTLVEGLQSEQIKIENGEIQNINRGQASEFGMAQAFRFAQGLWKTHNFSAVADRATLETKLDEAIASMSQTE